MHKSVSEKAYKMHAVCLSRPLSVFGTFLLVKFVKMYFTTVVLTSDLSSAIAAEFRKIGAGT